MEVFVSLTTISSRLGVLRKCLDSLLNQTYPVNKILLTIPKKSLRGDQITELPYYLYKSPYKDKIVIIRPEKDYGPIMKYIGGCDFLSKSQKYNPGSKSPKYNSDSIKSDLIFVCDDDQEYNKNLIRTLVDRYLLINDDETVITASGTTIMSTDIVYGHGSVLVPYNTIKIIRNSVLNSSSYVRKSCQKVDDNWVSIILKKYQIKVINMNLKNERYIKESTNLDDGLSQTTNRFKDIMLCTYAIDHENTYPIVALVIFIIFVISIITYNYLISSGKL